MPFSISALSAIPFRDFLATWLVFSYHPFYFSSTYPPPSLTQTRAIPAMSDHSPCIPVPRNLHQPTFFHPGSTFRPLRTIEGLQSPLSKFNFRERIALSVGVETLSKVAGCKRKPSEDDFDIFMGESRSPPGSPGDNHYSTHDMDREYTVKRTKTGNLKEFPLSKLLATLDKPQLLALINNIVDAHPGLQSEIASNIPRPTIQSVSSVFNGLEKKLQEAFPYTKWGLSKDDYSFNRVKPIILELKEVILDYAAHFTSPDEFPTTTFSFLHIANSLAFRLPNWENNIHNEIKRELLVKLSDHWKKAIDNAASKVSDGKIYGQIVVSEWAKNLAQHNNDSNGIFQQAVEVFVEKLGWIIGINETSSYSNYSSQSTPNHYHHSNPVMPV
ncbi:hypothetical protein G9A89_014872 [Geosiphon pyriformis]|nr:hypothetical protein G9A89_014872 [Geosiphon pyriformis]